MLHSTSASQIWYPHSTWHNWFPPPSFLGFWTTALFVGLPSTCLYSFQSFVLLPSCRVLCQLSLLSLWLTSVRHYIDTSAAIHRPYTPVSNPELSWFRIHIVLFPWATNTMWLHFDIPKLSSVLSSKSICQWFCLLSTYRSTCQEYYLLLPLLPLLQFVSAGSDTLLRSAFSAPLQPVSSIILHSSLLICLLSLLQPDFPAPAHSAF